MALAKTTRAPYRGAFLAGARLARQCEPTDGQKAADWYEEGLRVDPCAEELSRGLMIAYHRLGRKAAVADVYERCLTALAARLGGTPSPETERLFKTLRAD
jgi:DNA-binding SARP family transcriptional activator